MSYIINNTNAFVNIKLTETGRQKLAQGLLNFNSWAIGDSEVNYDREEIFDNNPTDFTLSGTSKVFRPFDRQPNIKHFITATSNNNANLNPLATSDINTIKAVVNNQATERGFFVDSSLDTQTGDTYVKAYGTVSGAAMSGGTDLVIGSGYTYAVGDYILLKVSNDTLGTIPGASNAIPVPYLWYKIQSTGTTTTAGDTVTLDRALPNTNASSSNNEFFIYTSDEVYGGFGFETTTPYWNSNTLSFQGCCDVSCGDVPVWNMNNVWCEDLAGMTGSSINSTPSTPNESFEKFGSNEYLGTKYPYFEYDCVGTGSSFTTDVCGVPGESVIDSARKSISILHYTNNTISNFYGEFFYIDGDNSKNTVLELPTLMYHRRIGSTEAGNVVGMTFIASGTSTTLGNSQVEYVDLIEDPTKVSDTPKVVGKVFPQLKTVVFDDDEIVAAMSYKSNRNWTLPPLTANLVNSASGATNGILATTKTMYITYSFENGSGTGLTTTLPCQYYTKIQNNTSNSKDVEFRIADVDLLPYMRKEEKGSYDGRGFSAREFKVLYQIVDNFDDRPAADAWKVYDYTTTAITSGATETIDPLLLENQSPAVNGFVVSQAIDSSATTFSIMNSLSMATNSSPEALQFGDERFFYGNLGTYIGASIYKTTFRLNINADDFKTTGNPTRSNAAIAPADIRVTEVGIYDGAGDLVMIGKLSKSVILSAGSTITMELSMDF